MLRNTAAQTLHVIAFNESGRVSGEAENITCTLAIDGGTRSALAAAAPVEIDATGEYVFALTAAETDGHALSFVPACETAGVQVLAVPSNVIYTAAVLSEAALTQITDAVAARISAAEIVARQPLTAAGALNPLTRGDDYLVANGRELSWTITLPGFNTTGAACHFGARSGSNSWLVVGTVASDGDDVTLTFDLASEDTIELPPGMYVWSVDLHNGAGHRMTQIRGNVVLEDSQTIPA